MTAATTDGEAPLSPDALAERVGRGEPLIVVDVRPGPRRLRRPVRGAVPIGLEELQKLARRVGILDDLAREEGVETFGPIGHVYFGRRFGWLPAREERVVAFAEDPAKAREAATALRDLGLPAVEPAAGPPGPWAERLPRTWHRAATLNRRWIRRLGMVAAAALVAWVIVELTSL